MNVAFPTYIEAIMCRATNSAWVAAGLRIHVYRGTLMGVLRNSLFTMDPRALCPSPKKAAPAKPFRIGGSTTCAERAATRKHSPIRI